MLAKPPENRRGSWRKDRASLPPASDLRGHLDNGDTCQIDRIGRTLPSETADPGSSGFPKIALDEGTGINEIHRHVNVARE